ncbi:MAG: hypothetical protein ACREL3_13420 [Gemmatimonadales bacterium]
MVPLCALLLVVGCNGDPTDPLRNGVDKLVASPSQMFIELGERKVVQVGAVDAQGNPLEFDYLVTATGSGITVARDSTYLPVYVNDTLLAVPPEAPVFQFNVVATGYGNTSFTVSAGGKDVVIPVQVVPQNQLGAAFSSTTPALGDTITLTLDQGAVFSDTSTFTLAGGTVAPKIVERDVNGTFIRFLAPPNVNSGMTITGVTSTADPTLIFTPTTSELLQTPFIDSVDVVFSNATPTVGQTVTATLPNLIKFVPGTALTFPDQLAPAANVTVAADSLSLTFEAPPNATGTARVDSLVFPGDFVLELPTKTAITAQNIGTTVAATFSTQTPAINQSVTLTAPAGFSFDPAATLDFAGTAPLITSQNAGAITFTPGPGITAPAGIAGVILNSAPQFNLTMATTDTLTVSATVPAIGGTSTTGTAPLITIPGAGATNIFYDASTYTGADITGDGGVGAQYYKFVLAAPATLTIAVASNNAGPDLDGVLCTDVGCSAPQFFAASGAHDESGSVTLGAGTYYLAAVNFDGGASAWTSITITH